MRDEDNALVLKNGELAPALCEALGEAGLLIHRREWRKEGRSGWFATVMLRPGGCEWGPYSDAATALVEGVRALCNRLAEAQTMIAASCEECGAPILVCAADSDRHCDECIRAHAVA